MVALLDLGEIRNQKEELIAEIETIFELASEEKRDLTDEENTRVNEIQGEDGKGGILAKLDADEERAEAFAQRKAQKLLNKLKPTIEGQSDSPRITVPVRAKSAGRLRHFETQEDAYVAGQFFLGAVFGKESAQRWCQDHGFWNVMGEGTATKGGILVPEELQRTLTRLRESRGVFPRFARTYPMGSDQLLIPRPVGDVTAYWPGENVEITASDLSLGSAELTAKKLACLTRISSELDEDSVVDIGMMVTESMAYVMADKVDEAGFNGDGTSTYGGATGLKNALTDADPASGGAGAVVNAQTGNDAADNLDLLDFQNVVGALPNYEGASEARWYISKPVYVASYVRLMNALGGSVRSEISGDMQPEILGYPVTFTNVLPKTTSTLGSTIIAYFGHLDLAATYGTRRSTRTAVSSERYFEFDQIGIKATERIGITVHERGDTIKERPILALKTAS